MAEAWHVKELKNLTQMLNSNPQKGLNDEQAAAAQQKYGKNQLKAKKGISPWTIILNQFKNIIVVLLLVATVIALLLGDVIEAIAIFAVIILNALFGFITEYKAEQAMDALKKMVTTNAKVIRNGRLDIIPAEEVVPGDILVLEEGDRITADGRLLSADNLGVIEASLTGESEPVNKEVKDLKDKKIPIGDRINMVYMGTNVARGNAKVLVTSTGQQTEIGNISELLEETEKKDTPLEERLGRMGRSLVGISLGIAVIIAIAGILTGKPLFEMLETSIALAIAAVPEGLPAVATITLAIGMSKMAKQNAIIRRLPAVETLGSTTIICTDKTGTITENEMTMERIWLAGQNITITGNGYDPQGEFMHGDKKLEPNKGVLAEFLRAGALCNNAALEKNEENQWSIIGDPTEGALVVAARKMGFDREEAEEYGYRELREIPFDSKEKRMATYYSLPGDKKAVFVKGAPNVVLDSCVSIHQGEETITLNPELREQVVNANQELASKGLRVLALAYRPIDTPEEEAYSKLTLLGLAGIMDPPREEAKKAIAEAKRAHIRTIMITGDHPDTAEAIGKRVGLLEKGFKVIHGSTLEGMSKEELAREVQQTSIFARVSPKHKLDIVEALQKNGEIVSMTGDGVNDAPALKKADIGVSMGITGTVVAKEASDMVLQDDNFSTIVKAVRHGRVIFDNIHKFIHYLFSCNLSEILVIFIAILMGVPIPLVALQILWLNLVTDVFPALSLGWDPAERGVMQRAPRNPRQAILTGRFKAQIAVHAIILAAGTLGTYLYILNTTDSLAAARTAAFASLALVQLLHVFNVRREGFTSKQAMFNNPYIWGAVVLVLGLQALAIYNPFLNMVLRTIPLNTANLFVVAIGSILPIILIQIINKTGYFLEEPEPGPGYEETGKSLNPTEIALARNNKITGGITALKGIFKRKLK